VLWLITSSAVRPSQIESLARAVAAAWRWRCEDSARRRAAFRSRAKFVDAVVADLKAAGGKSIVVAGDQQARRRPPACHQMNLRSAMWAKTVVYAEP